MSVNDFGIEVLKKASEEITAGDHSEYQLLARIRKSALPDGAATEATLLAVNGKLNSLGQKAMSGSVPIAIASDQSTLLVRNEPQTESRLQHSFSIVADSILAQSTDTSILTITNPSGSGKTVYIYSMGAWVNPSSNNWAVFKVNINASGISAGTTAMAYNRYAGSATASVITAKTLPTVTTAGNLLEKMIAPGGSTLGSEAAARPLNDYIILAPNTSLLIVANAKSNNVPVTIVLKWFEV